VALELIYHFAIHGNIMQRLEQAGLSYIYR